MADGGGILVCGETLVDLVPVAGGLRRPVPGGGPYNTAIAAAKLGAPTALLTHVSHDAFGSRCVQDLAAAGVDESLVMRHDVPTTLAVADVDEHGAARYLFYWQGTSNDVAIQSFPDPVRTPVAIWAGSIASVLWRERDELRAWIARHYADIPLTFDVNVRPALISHRQTYAERIVPWLSVAHVARASTDDLEFLYPGVSVRDAVNAWLDAYPRIEIAVITCGAAGSLAFRRGEPSPLRIAAHKVGVVDTYTGAFLDGFYRRRLDLPEALRRAAVAAAITCTRPGAQPPDATELANELRRVTS